MDRQDMLPISRVRPRWRQCRRGAILVWFAFLIVMLLGMVGLVIDVGLMFSAQRQAQNAADAGALAAAYDLMWGKSNTVATATATTFVNNYNQLSSAPAPVVNIPPASGPYAGEPHFVEVIVTVPLQTYFIQVLGVARNQTVRARAVAGSSSLLSATGSPPARRTDSM